MLRFAEELLLLLLDEQTGEFSHVPARTLGYALAGAALMDLALAGRIDTDVDSLTLTDPTPLGDDLLDPILADISKEAEAGAPASPPDVWVRRIAEQSDDLRDKSLERLIEKGILETDQGNELFSLSRLVSRTRRYPLVEGTRQREVHDRIMGVFFSDDIPSPADVVCIGLADACGVLKRLLTPSEYREVKERIELIGGMDLIGRSVTNAVHKIALSETQALRRAIRKQGGGWPQASGGLPIVGHTFKLAGDIRAFLTEQYLKLGPVFEVRALGRRYVVIAGQEANIFAQKEGAAHLRMWEQWSGLRREFGTPNVIIGLDGADHRRLRKTLQDGYSQGTILRQIPAAIGVVDRELAQLHPTRPVPGFYAMQRITTEQIVLLTTGTSSRKYIDDAITFMTAMELVHITKKRPRAIMWLPSVRRARRRLELAFEKMLVAHEKEPAEGARHDLVDDLLELHTAAPDQLTHTDLFVNVMGPALLGLETVSGTIAFMLYVLLKNPALLARVRAEADVLFADDVPTAEGIRRMKATQWTVIETLRMYPVAPTLARTVQNSFDFGGYHIPAGTDLLVATTVPHYLPEFFPEPERFDIERHAPQRREYAHPGVYAPFGLGQHVCLGQGFAYVQIALTIAALLHRAEFALDPPNYALKLSYSPTLHPHKSFKIRMLGPRKHGSTPA